MTTFFVLVVIGSNILASLPFWSRIQKGLIPTTTSFATISVVLYYDIGLLLELLGYPYESTYFESFLDASPEIMMRGLVILALAPWLFRLGSFISAHKVDLEKPLYRIKRGKKDIFYLLTGITACIMAFYGFKEYSQASSVWSARADLGAMLGPLVIVLYLPIHYLAFYIGQEDSKTRRGTTFSIFLLLTAILSTIVIGERTTVLLPFLMLGLFRFKINLKRFALYAVIGIISATALLGIYKWQFASEALAYDEMVAQTITGDMSRSQVLATALEMTEPIGTEILPYPMAGYVYSAFFFVPRSVVPLKGNATANYFTSELVGTPADDIDWGFGVGAIEEILLNVGYLISFPMLILYGFMLGFIDRLSSRITSLTIPTRLAALWLCGYHLPAVLLLFGSMSLVVLVLHRLFSDVVKVSGEASEQPQATTTVKWVAS